MEYPFDMYLETPDIRIDMCIKNRKSLVIGNSGTGKTFISDIFRLCKRDKFANEIIKTNIDLDSLYVVSNKLEFESILHVKDSIIIMDKIDTYAFNDADGVLVEDKSVAEFIENSNNTFIIMHRGKPLSIKCFITSYYEVFSRNENDKIYFDIK